MKKQTKPTQAVASWEGIFGYVINDVAMVDMNGVAALFKYNNHGPFCKNFKAQKMNDKWAERDTYSDYFGDVKMIRCNDGANTAQRWLGNRKAVYLMGLEATATEKEAWTFYKNCYANLVKNLFRDTEIISNDIRLNRRKAGMSEEEQLRIFKDPKDKKIAQLSKELVTIKASMEQFKTRMRQAIDAKE